MRPLKLTYSCKHCKFSSTNRYAIGGHSKIHRSRAPDTGPNPLDLPSTPVLGLPILKIVRKIVKERKLLERDNKRLRRQLKEAQEAYKVLVHAMNKGR